MLDETLNRLRRARGEALSETQGLSSVNVMVRGRKCLIHSHRRALPPSCCV